MNRQNSIDILYHQQPNTPPPEKPKGAKAWKKIVGWAAVISGIAGVISAAIAVFPYVGIHPSVSLENPPAKTELSSEVEKAPAINGNSNSSIQTPATNNSNSGTPPSTKISKPPAPVSEPEKEIEENVSTVKISPEKSAQSFYERATKLYDKDDYVGAIAECNRGIKIYPGNTALMELKRTVETVQKMKKSNH
jgi:hypothetical protein